MTTFAPRHIRDVKDLTPEELLQLLEIARVLRMAMERNDQEKLKELEHSRPMLLMLLEYLIINSDNPNIDQGMVLLLEKFLGISLSKNKDKDKDLEEEREEELSEEEKKRRMQHMMYEVYKTLNPHQIAGETAMQNFIDNVRTRGIKVAMQHEGKEFASQFRPGDLKNLESYKHSFVSALAKEGHKGGGKGI